MEQKLAIFKSLFKDRKDVFAIRWERDGKSGHIPAYFLNWDQYKLHQAKGGTIKNFEDKQYAPLEIVFEISNAEIRPEFAAIRNYFAKALKKNGCRKYNDKENQEHKMPASYLI
ncbi:MAG: hypothetical protein WKF89_09620 [Chitinophagaceae bacterium]